MELYALDSQFRRIALYDVFESLIWTERWSDVGDFELIIPSNVKTRAQFVGGTRLAINDSYRIMTVETVEKTRDAEGRQFLKVNGRSLEQILHDRLLAEDAGWGAIRRSWMGGGSPGTIMRRMFEEICVMGTLSQNDIIPNIVIDASLFPPDTPVEDTSPSNQYIHQVDAKPLFDAIKEMADLYDLGFRLYLNPETSQLYFNVYIGSDRTTGQTTLPAVVFSPELDTLQDIKELATIQNVKNFAHVFYTESGSEAEWYVGVAGNGADNFTSGFDRRCIMLEVSSIPENTSNITDYLYQYGLDELKKYLPLTAFDGELNQRGQYKYGSTYFLGDLVEMRSGDGASNIMRVTEQIFVSDREGDRSYPTLSRKVIPAEPPPI